MREARGKEIRKDAKKSENEKEVEKSDKREKKRVRIRKMWRWVTTREEKSENERREE
jgi:hypothetical protein